MKHMHPVLFMIPPKGLKSSEKLTKKPPLEIHSCLVYMDVSENGGTQQLLVLLLKMTILGCFGSTPIFGNIHIYIYMSSTLASWARPCRGLIKSVFPPPSPKSQNPWRTILTLMRSNSFWTMQPLGEEIHPIFVEFSRRLFFFPRKKRRFPGDDGSMEGMLWWIPLKGDPFPFFLSGFCASSRHLRLRRKSLLKTRETLCFRLAKFCSMPDDSFVVDAFP